SYQTQGMEGVKRRKTKVEYTVQFKLDTVQFMLETGASYSETAIQFHLNNPSLIVRWLKVFREQGIEGLKPRSKRRNTMSKKPNKKRRPYMSKKTNKKKKKEEKKLTREEELERDNELLRLEVAYLKKLRAFRENPNAFHEKHKQKWHLSSKKKDSD